MQDYLYHDMFHARRQTGTFFNKGLKAFGDSGFGKLWGVVHLIRAAGYALSIPFVALKEFMLIPHRTYFLKKHLFEQLSSDERSIAPTHREEVKNEIRQFIKTTYPHMPPEEQELYTKFALSTYASTQEHYAPLVWSWAKTLLDTAKSLSSSRESMRDFVDEEYLRQPKSQKEFTDGTKVSKSLDALLDNPVKDLKKRLDDTPALGPIHLRPDKESTATCKKPAKIVFMARDGIPPLHAAEALKRLRPAEYGDVHVCLAYLSRKVMKDLDEKGEDGDRIFQAYMEQLGIERGDNVIFVDVGFAGSMIKPIKDKLAKGDFIHPTCIDFSYLISLTNNPSGYNAFGFLADNSTRRMRSCEFAGGNPGVHWIEDTHQTAQISPKYLVERADGTIEPNIISEDGTVDTVIGDNPKDYILRHWAIEAIKRAHTRTHTDAGYRASFARMEGADPLNPKATELFRKAPAVLRDDFNAFTRDIIRGKRILLVDHDSNHANQYAKLLLEEPTSLTIRSWHALHRGWDNAASRFKAWTYLKRAAIVTAMVITTIVTPILFILDGIYLLQSYARKSERTSMPHIPATQEKPREGGCSEYFQSPAFREYFQNLRFKTREMLEDAKYSEIRATLADVNKQRLCSPLEHNLITAITMLQSFDEASVISYKHQHREITRLLEGTYEQICQMEEDPSDLLKEGKRLLEELHYHKYSHMDLLTAISRHLSSAKFHLPSTEGKSLGEFLSLAYKTLEQNRDLHPSGPMEELFDAHYFGNLPFVLPAITKRSGKTCQMIRMASITHDTERNTFGRTSHVEITETFKMFMAELKQQDKHHLFVNLMGRHLQGNEIPRTRETEKLDTDDSNNVHTLTLDMNSDFYKQKGMYGRKRIETSSFTEQLKNKLLNGKHYHWPKGLDRGELELAIPKIIRQVQAEHFSVQEDLTVEERRDFIELVYNHVIDHVIEELDVDSANITCKDCVDRAMARTVSYYAHKSHEAGKPIDKEMLALLALAPAILVGHRPMQKDRFTQMLHTLHRLAPEEVTEEDITALTPRARISYTIQMPTPHITTKETCLQPYTYAQPSMAQGMIGPHLRGVIRV